MSSKTVYELLTEVVEVLNENKDKLDKVDAADAESELISGTDPNEVGVDVVSGAAGAWGGWDECFATGVREFHLAGWGLRRQRNWGRNFDFC